MPLGFNFLAWQSQQILPSSPQVQQVNASMSNNPLQEKESQCKEGGISGIQGACG